MPEILIATDSESVYDEVNSVISRAGTVVRRVRSGAAVRESINAEPAGVVVVDLQIGAMGGFAVALDLRLEADAGRLDPTRILLLLDRRADVFLARRAGVDGWLVKPLDPIKVRRAVAALVGGGTYHDDTDLPQPVAVPFSSDKI